MKLNNLIIELEAIRDLKEEIDLYIKHHMKTSRKSDKNLTFEERYSIIFQRFSFQELYSRLMNLYGSLGISLPDYIKILKGETYDKFY